MPSADRICVRLLAASERSDGEPALNEVVRRGVSRTRNHETACFAIALGHIIILQKVKAASDRPRQTPA
jgi:hypothetical protein